MGGRLKFLKIGESIDIWNSHNFLFHNKCVFYFTAMSIFPKERDTTHKGLYAVCAFTYLGAMLASNHALQHVAYPTQVNFWQFTFIYSVYFVLLMEHLLTGPMDWMLKLSAYCYFFIFFNLKPTKLCFVWYITPGQWNYTVLQKRQSGLSLT